MFGFVSLTNKTFAFLILQSLKEMKPLDGIIMAHI